MGVVAIIVILVTMGFEIQAASKVVTKTPIQHVVIIMQENHSFFNYWGDYPGVIGGVADATCQQTASPKQLQRVNATTTDDDDEGFTGTAPPVVNSTTSPNGSQVICPFETNNPISTGPLNHSGPTANIAYDNGSMDGFLLANKNNPNVMSYYNATVLGYYWGLAEHYTLNDMFFSSYMSYSLPNHWAAIAGDAPAISINNTKFTSTEMSDLLQEASVITTMLEAVQNTKPITVKYYDAPVKYANLTEAIQLAANTPDNFGGAGVPGGYWNPSLEKTDAYTTPLRNDFVQRTDIISDISKGKLPSISWVIPNQEISEHPPDSVILGEQWVQSVVSAIMSSQYWSNTAIFIMTDDWGGFYDPIAPPTLISISPGSGNEGTQMELGFRVSSLVVSPYSVRGIVNTQFSFESVLHFIDYNWGLPMLNARVGAASNMLSDFNFGQRPLSPWRGVPLTPAQKLNVTYYASLDTPDVD